jgi:hypothetical protein
MHDDRFAIDRRRAGFLTVPAAAIVPAARAQLTRSETASGPLVQLYSTVACLKVVDRCQGVPSKFRLVPSPTDSGSIDLPGRDQSNLRSRPGATVSMKCSQEGAKPTHAGVLAKSSSSVQVSGFDTRRTW